MAKKYLGRTVSILFSKLSKILFINHLKVKLTFNNVARRFCKITPHLVPLLLLHSEFVALFIFRLLCLLKSISDLRERKEITRFYLSTLRTFYKYITNDKKIKLIIVNFQVKEYNLQMRAPITLPGLTL